MNIPQALQPKYPMTSANQKLQLYKGEIILRESEKKDAGQRHDGTVSLRWLPSPSLELEVEQNSSSTDPPRQGMVELVDYGWAAEYLLSTSPSVGHNGRGVIRDQLTGYFPQVSSRLISSIVFQIPNAESFHGRPISDDGNNIRAERLEFTVGKWRLILEMTSGSSALIKELKGQGGFGFTASGMLTMADESGFEPSEADKMLETLYWSMSFIWGRFTGPVLLVGLDSTGHPAWEKWSVPVLTSWPQGPSWFPGRAPGSLSQVVTGVRDMLDDASWKDSFPMLVHWYVEALNQAGALKGALVMIQMAFENIWWIDFHLRLGMITDHTKIAAADKLRLVLDRYGIPRPIPSSLVELDRAAKGTTVSDGPAAVTEMRNRIVHPGGKKAQIVPAGEPLFDTWSLSVWYLEMILLALLKYSGPYRSRLSRIGNVHDTENVPWA